MKRFWWVKCQPQVGQPIHEESPLTEFEPNECIFESFVRIIVCDAPAATFTPPLIEPITVGRTLFNTSPRPSCAF
jgi:hypothetical protein